MTNPEKMQEQDSEVDQQNRVDEVPPPPPPPPGGRGPSERRRAHVVLPDAQPDEGPTYYRIGIDYAIDENDTEFHVQCGRIKKLENLDKAGANLKQLKLIANCIEKIEGLETNVNLEHLELYQNLLKKVENIGHLSHLTTLDLSFNKIRSCESLSQCDFKGLKSLYMSSNKISDIEGVSHFPNLTMLEFGSNRLRAVPSDLGALTNLQELWLGKNKITSMALPPLPALRHISMQSNRLETWDASLFQNAPGLTHAYFGHNALPNLIEEFSLLTELKELDLAGNRITKITPFPALTKLEDLWMNDNQIDDLSEVRNLASFPSLKTIYLERNPMHGLGEESKEAKYKEAILDVLPDVWQLDAVRQGHTVEIITDGSERNVLGIRKR